MNDYRISATCDECGTRLFAGGYCTECSAWREDYR